MKINQTRWTYHGAEKKTKTGLGMSLERTFLVNISSVAISFPPDFATASSGLNIDRLVGCWRCDQPTRPVASNALIFITQKIPTMKRISTCCRNLIVVSELMARIQRTIANLDRLFESALMLDYSKGWSRVERHLLSGWIIEFECDGSVPMRRERLVVRRWRVITGVCLL